MLDPWGNLVHQTLANSSPSLQLGRQVRSSPSPLSRRLVEDEANVSSAEQEGIMNAFDRYQVSVARAKTADGRRGHAVPDMQSWAQVVGVDIKSSKRTRRWSRQDIVDGKHRRFRKSTSSVLRPKSPLDPAQDSEDCASIAEREGHESPRFTGNVSQVPQVVALDGFLSDLQGRITSLEQRPGQPGTRQTHNQSGERTGDTRAASDPRSKGEGESESRVDMFGIPQDVMAEALEVRRRYTRAKSRSMCISLRLIPLHRPG